LKNYAAPRGYTTPSGSPNLSVNTKLEASSPTLSTISLTSTDSTPLQTPTLDGEEEGWKINHEEQESVTWSLHTENDHFSVTPPTPTASLTPISTSPPPLLKQKPTPPKLNLVASVFNPPVAVSSPSSVQSPRRQQQQRYYEHRHYQPMSSASPHPSPPLGGDSAASDAIYQALVREWCFAQAPSSSSSSESGERTPVVVKTPGSPSPLGLGLVCAMGDE
jgi:hypothetical protein